MGRSGKGEADKSSASDGLLTAGVLAIALVRGVAKRPADPERERHVTTSPTTPLERSSQRREERSGAYIDLTQDPPDADDLTRAHDTDRGREADKPSEIPARGFLDVAKRVIAESKADNLPLLAAGVAFYSVLALFPAMVALVSIYGLVADPAEVSRQLQDLSSAMPAEAADIIVGRMEDLAAAEDSSLGLSAVIGIAVALWSASSGMSWLMKALTLIYDEEETRTFVPLRGLALLLTFGATVGLVITLMLITGASSMAKWAGLGEIGQQVVSIARWPALGVVMIVGLALLYRYGPNRSTPQLRWASWGSAIGMLVWLVASAGFAVYVSVVGSNNESYGSLAGIIVLMLWLWLTCVAILLGAQINAELEHQTARDTTTGPDEPIGQRDAVVADSVGPTAEELARESDDGSGDGSGSSERSAPERSGANREQAAAR